MAATEHGHELVLLVETTADRDFCCECGVQAGSKGRARTLVRDVPMGDRPVVLVWAKRVWRCEGARLSESPSQVYSLRIPVERLEQLRQLAEDSVEAPTVMVRRWVVERLDQEWPRVVGTPPVAGWEEFFDAEAVHELQLLLESVPASRHHLVREQFKKLHRQLFSTLAALVGQGDALGR